MTNDKKKPIKPQAPSADEQPEIYGITKGKNGIVLNRRSFLGALAATGVLAACPPAMAASGRKPAASPKTLGNGKAHEGAVKSLLMQDKLLFSLDAKTHKIWEVTKGNLKGTLLKDDLRKTLDELQKLGGIPPEIYEYLNESELAWKAPVLAHGPDGKMLAMDAKDGATLWKLAEGKPEKMLLKNIPRPVRSLAVHPDGTLFAVGSENGSITIGNLADGKLLHTIQGTSGAVLSLAVHPNGELLLSGHQYGKIHLWQLPEGKSIKALFHGNNASNIKITPNGALAITAGKGNLIKLWDMPELKLKTSFPVPLAEGTTAMDVSRDSQILATGTPQGRIYLWRLPEGEMLGCMFDPDLLGKGDVLALYRQMGREIQTQSCDKALPKGATCVCDCVGDNRMCGTARQICTCDAIAVPVGHAIPKGVCVCDIVAVGTGKGPAASPPKAPSGCSCVGHVSHGGGGGGGGSHYWRPN